MWGATQDKPLQAVKEKCKMHILPDIKLPWLRTHGGSLPPKVGSHP